jgi:hypothetical protein
MIRKSFLQFATIGCMPGRRATACADVAAGTRFIRSLVLCGAVVSGAVQVPLTPVDVTQPAAAGFPGQFDGVKADGVLTPIVSFGVVRRLATAPAPVWETLGPNGGVLPAANTCGLSSAKLRFDAGGNPVIGAIAVGNCGVASSGTVVYRYDVTLWSSTGGFQADSSYVQGSGDCLGFAVSGSDAYMGWVNTRNSQNATVVQKNTAAGWTAIGGGQGEIAQYTLQGLNDTTAYTPRLLALDGELYLAVVVVSGQNTGRPSFNVALLRKVAD